VVAPQTSSIRSPLLACCSLFGRRGVALSAKMT
jgi:hypothetical protein